MQIKCQRDRFIAFAKNIVPKVGKENSMIKKLLKSHRYPPEGMDDAVATVMQQCELWADNVMNV